MSSLNVSERCPCAHFDLNMKIKLSAVPVSLDNQRLGTLFSNSSQNKGKGSVHQRLVKTLKFSVVSYCSRDKVKPIPMNG